MARIFAAKGRNLALCSRRIDRLELLRDELIEQNPNIKITVSALDVNDHDAVFQVFKKFSADLGHLDRVIVNAGLGHGASVGTGYFNANKKMAITNFVSALAQCEAALELFRAQNHGHLVTISAFSAVRGFPGAKNVYAASKAALSSLSEGLRVELMGSPIKVSCIHPGFIRSNMTAKIKNLPFVVDTATGAKSIVNAMEKEVATAYVPFWPWSILRHLLKIVPSSLIAKIG